ncbi:MAG: hypothetical protein ACYDHZ_11865, partial [Dehalococcoidia bacterium]
MELGTWSLEFPSLEGWGFSPSYKCESLSLNRERGRGEGDFLLVVISPDALYESPEQQYKDD